MPGFRHAEEQPPRRRRWMIALLTVTVLVAAALGAVLVTTNQLGDNVARVAGAFNEVPEGERPPEDPNTLTFLLIGTDTRAEGPTTGTDADPDASEGSVRGDAVLVARVATDGSSASVVSIPRDSWVDIPGHGRNKINAAYSFGGASLLIRTAEQISGLRIDHFGVIDFAGFQHMVDAVGGIDVEVARATVSRGVTFREGTNHLDGAQALVYVRQRHELPGGDLDRAKRQQSALRALMVSAQRSLDDPVGLYDLADATSRAVSVDDTLSNGGIAQLLLNMRGLRSDTVEFGSAPVRGLGQEGDQSVVYLDDDRGRQMWDAVRSDTLARWLDANEDDRLSSTPN